MVYIRTLESKKLLQAVYIPGSMYVAAVFRRNVENLQLTYELTRGNRKRREDEQKRSK